MYLTDNAIIKILKLVTEDLNKLAIKLANANYNRELDDISTAIFEDTDIIEQLSSGLEN